MRDQEKRSEASGCSNQCKACRNTHIHTRGCARGHQNWWWSSMMSTGRDFGGGAPRPWSGSPPPVV